ncbi:MAG: D-alanyl-D-alanine carboxypeptidase/D-alanyl-D-alanine-endopeptidase, partial [Coprobacter sp.]|nr:D-alanyl-D-alanine carboxypeptidase/D-alanyl-D-alanine-endopeptidase [Coprobacter sp.]
IPVIESVTPEIPGLEFDNYLKAAASSVDSVYIYGAPFSCRRTLYGTLPANRRSFTVKGDIPDPPLYLGQVVTRTLRSGGITVSGDPVTVRQLRQSRQDAASRDMKPLLTFLSDPLIDIVTQTNRQSNNLFAETLLRQIALAGHPAGSASGGLDVLLRYWKKRGVDTTPMMLCDGSGLSPVNAISARTLADILLKTYNGANGERFLHTLPQAGKEGTVRTLLAGTPLAGRLYLKSGSMSRVQCFAGYYIGQKPYVVVLLVNNFTGPRSQLKKQIEQLFLSRLSDK